SSSVDVMAIQLASAEGRLAVPRLEIDLEAVAANSRLFAGRTASDLMAVVKADGFGHGAVAVACTALAHGATWLGVTSIDEALALRRVGIVAPTLSWLNGLDANFEGAIRHRIDLAVPSVDHLAAVATAAIGTGRAAAIHLHADTGMARDGAPPGDWDALCRRAAVEEARGLVRVVGLMGHLGCADTPADNANVTGRSAFADFVTTARRAGLRPSILHLAATSATLTDPRAHHDLCRVGAGLVGIDPSGTTPLRGAMTLSAPVISVREVPADTSVGYGHGFVTERATRLALLPLGYADGMPRAASGRAEVLVAGTRRRVVGLISMDQLVVDIGTLPVTPGDTAIVMGPGDHGEPTVADWARWSGSIPHEIVTGLGQRITRVTAPAAQVPAFGRPLLRSPR
ncbi:MAG: alanine racemase, partial [Aeromicrobium sp.]|nr:alanine racemase [Aeromicrobium sp.]